MRGAQEFVGGLLGSLGFAVEVVPTDLHPIILAQRAGDPGWPHVDHLRPLRRAAARSAGAVEDAALRADRARRTASAAGAPRTTRARCSRTSRRSAGCWRRIRTLPLRITFLIEGEEEIGSPSFPPFLEKYHDRLRGRLRVPVGHRLPTRRPGGHHLRLARPGTCATSTSRGPGCDLHSGPARRRAAQPIQALAEICASLHTRGGRVNMPGLLRRRARGGALGAGGAARSSHGEGRRTRISSASTPSTRRRGYTPFEAIRFQPTLEFNGIGGGYQGEGTQDGHSEQGVREDQLPPRAQPDAGQDQDRWSWTRSVSACPRT